MASYRAFFALPVSVQAEQQLQDLVAELQFDLEHTLSAETVFRWVKPENYHITLAFLGDIQARDVERLHRLALPIVEGYAETFAGRQASQLLIRAVEWFPSPLKPRLLVAGVADNEPLQQLQRALSRALRTEGFRLEKKAFRPYITLARCTALMAPPDLRLVKVDIETELDELVLFNSELTSSGPRYSPLFVELLGY